ncbi:MAG: type VI secretion system-associated FHA domain protein TagH [Woeseiaceae bacterium]|nr:type VI secretion system-associated FHA domain protein TagH [Woeseiaceae bacterium]
MPLQLEIVSKHKETLEDDHVRVFREVGGMIGRSFENDWVLPDPDRFISGKHATIDFHSGAYYLADISTNGVYINGEKQPLNKGNPRRLFHGDRLRMGDFEFEVTLEEGEGLEMPKPVTVVPGHIEQVVDEEFLESGIQMLDEEKITGGDAFQATLFGVTKTEDPVRNTDQQPNGFVPAPTQGEQKMIDTAHLLDAFMSGLDVSRTKIYSSTDPLEVMENAGKVLRECVDGMSDLLASRAALKSLFRLDQTTVLPRHNNPLKLADNPRESMMQLLVGKKGEYLEPVDAVREVCRDLKFHHDAALEAMTDACQEFANRFDPHELQQDFDKTLGGKPLFKKMNQVKYWQLYCDLYPIMTRPGSGQFPHQFSEKFGRCYERQLAAYKRLDQNGGPSNKKSLGFDEMPEASN